LSAIQQASPEVSRPPRPRADDLELADLELAAAALQALPRRPDSALRILTELSR
jgi:hypothetical protein